MAGRRHQEATGLAALAVSHALRAHLDWPRSDSSVTFGRWRRVELRDRAGALIQDNGILRDVVFDDCHTVRPLGT
jgi:hypothetical protein